MAKTPLEGLTPPFYLCDMEALEEKYRRLRNAFGRHFPALEIAYSYKTNYTPAMLQHLHDWGALAEVVSIHEWELARRLGLAGNRIIYNGPNKRFEDIETALDSETRINIDSLEEVAHVCHYARRTGKAVGVGIRINPAGGDGEAALFSRFGIPMEQLGEVQSRLRAAQAEITGLHIHLSSRRRDLAHYTELARQLGEAALRLGIDSIRHLDIGGGFGFVPEGMAGIDIPSFEQYAEAIHRALHALHPRLPEKQFIIEPGLALVASVFSYYAPVLAIKNLAGADYVFVDGSVHTVKPSNHNYNLPTQVLDRRGREKTGNERPYDIVGYTCMETDRIAREQMLPAIEPGDILRIGNVGAYTIVFKPPFIRPRPAIYLMDGKGETVLACREEGLDDWLQGCGLDPGRER